MNQKEYLYASVRKLKVLQFREPTDYGIDIVNLLKTSGISIELLPFETPGLRGMAIPGTGKENDIILLNSFRSAYERNFDCAHEMMHLGLHRNEKRKTFMCSDKIIANQNDFYEWQANEGAAEYCVPYVVLLQILKRFYPIIKKCNKSQANAFLDELSNIFMVPIPVIENRIDNLRFEIYQYITMDVPIANVKLMSKNEQRKLGMFIPSFYDMEITHRTTTYV